MTREELAKTKTYSKRLWNLMVEGDLVNKRTTKLYEENSYDLGYELQGLVDTDMLNKPYILCKALEKATSIKEVREMVKVAKARAAAADRWEIETTNWYFGKNVIKIT
jgi:hypothetical protein